MGLDKPPIPFQFNSYWMEYEEYKDLVESIWISYDNSNIESTCIHFLNNLNSLKARTITWEVERRKHDFDHHRIEETLC